MRPSHPVSGLATTALVGALSWKCWKGARGGIRPEVAETIWDYCYQVTPTAFHDEQRHKRRWDKTVDWEKVFLGRMNEWQQPAFFGELCSAQWEGRSNLGFLFLS
jgi:hypothetical protein